MEKRPAAIYMDCASTTPVDARVRDEVLRYLDEDFGNAGSRTHDYGSRARAAVEHARDLVAAVAGASRGDVVFTSGATESNNIAILGLARHGEQTGRRHIISTAIEHHAVLAPLAELGRRGFEVQHLMPDRGGAVDPEAVRRALRDDTLLVSIMHVNNETGIIQPIDEVASILGGSAAFFHVDAAQSFGKEIPTLRHLRIDLISVSGHKIQAPKGVGALIVRRRGGERPPLEPLMFGGGQERGWRPGTQPVHLIAGLGRASELALAECDERRRQCLELRRQLLEGLAPLRPVINGDPNRSVAHIVNLSIPGLDSETAMDAWQDIVAISNGAACTSQSYTCSHVLGAMDLPRSRQDGALRLSWCHLTPLPDFRSMIDAIEDAKRRHSL
jgi:cysteine desulfurase